MIALIALIYVVWRVYKAAQETGRKPWKWVAATIGVFFGVQLFIGVTAILIEVIGEEFYNWETGYFDRWMTLISIVATILSFVAIQPILTRVTRVPDVQPAGLSAPPPPPKFD